MSSSSSAPEITTGTPRLWQHYCTVYVQACECCGGTASPALECTSCKLVSYCSATCLQERAQPHRAVCASLVPKLVQVLLRDTALQWLAFALSFDDPGVLQEPTILFHKKTWNEEWQIVKNASFTGAGRSFSNAVYKYREGVKRSERDRVFSFTIDDCQSWFLVDFRKCEDALTQTRIGRMYAEVREVMARGELDVKSLQAKYFPLVVEIWATVCFRLESVSCGRDVITGLVNNDLPLQSKRASTNIRRAHQEAFGYSACSNLPDSELSRQLQEQKEQLLRRTKEQSHDAAITAHSKTLADNTVSLSFAASQGPVFIDDVGSIKLEFDVPIGLSPAALCFAIWPDSGVVLLFARYSPVHVFMHARLRGLFPASGHQWRIFTAGRAEVRVKKLVSGMLLDGVDVLNEDGSVRFAAVPRFHSVTPSHADHPHLLLVSFHRKPVAHHICELFAKEMARLLNRPGIIEVLQLEGSEKQHVVALLRRLKERYCARDTDLNALPGPPLLVFAAHGVNDPRNPDAYTVQLGFGDGVTCDLAEWLKKSSVITAKQPPQLILMVSCFSAGTAPNKKNPSVTRTSEGSTAEAIAKAVYPIPVLGWANPILPLQDVLAGHAFHYILALLQFCVGDVTGTIEPEFASSSAGSEEHKPSEASGSTRELALPNAWARWYAQVMRHPSSAVEGAFELLPCVAMEDSEFRWSKACLFNGGTPINRVDRSKILQQFSSSSMLPLSLAELRRKNADVFLEPAGHFPPPKVYEYDIGRVGLFTAFPADRYSPAQLKQLGEKLINHLSQSRKNALKLFGQVECPVCHIQFGEADHSTCDEDCESELEEDDE